MAFSEGAPLGSQTYSFAGFDTYGSESALTTEASQSRTGAPSSGRENSAGLSQNTLPRPAVGPGPEEEAGSKARGASAFGKSDSDTERRQWTQGKEGAGDKPAVGVGITSQGGASAQATPGAGKLGLTGMSSVSELQYADDWDEYSMNSSAGISGAAPSRGPSSQSMRSGAVLQMDSNAPPPSIPEGSATEASQSNASPSPAVDLFAAPSNISPSNFAPSNLSPSPAAETPKPAFEVELAAPDFSSKRKRPR